MNWEQAYKTFKISSHEPSRIVKYGLKLLRPGAVIDLGCGNGRNSYYAASHGHDVSGVDVVDVRDFDIPFHKTDVMQYEHGKVNGIIATRLMQYVDANECLKRSSERLLPGGVMMINYTESGGIFDSGIEVERYSHKIGELEQMIKDAGLNILMLAKGESKSTHVPYNLPASTYDILATRL